MKVIAKGHEIEVRMTKAAYERKAVLFANNIIEDLRKLGVLREDVEITTNLPGGKIAPATIEFWAERHYLRFSYSMAKRFIDNLYVISKLIELEVEEVLTGKKDMVEFLHMFAEDSNRKEIAKELNDAKKTLGLDSTETDVDKINQVYKKLAREHHPDMGGNVEEFQKVNKAHKMIKKHMGL